VSDAAIALAFENGLPYVGLRDHAHDPELDRVIPSDAARFARAVPLSATDDHVRLAVADPEPDLAALQPYLGDRRVELAIAPRDELDEVLGPVPEAPPAPEPAAVEGTEEAEPETEAVGAEAEALAAEPEAEPLAAEPEPAPEPAVVEGSGTEEAKPETEAVGAEAEALAAEPEAEPLAAEPLAAEPQAEPLAAEPEAEPLAAEREHEVAEAEPLAEPEAPAPAAAEQPAAEQPAAEHPAAEPLAAEPAAAAPDAAAQPPAPGEDPSWLAPPRKRGWLRAIGRFLLYVLVLAIICGAVAAYLLTR
jgi:hypothetical protein